MSDIGLYRDTSVIMPYIITQGVYKIDFFLRKRTDISNKVLLLKSNEYKLYK